MNRPKNTCLCELAKLLDAAGASDPLNKVYLATEPLSNLPLVLLLFILSYAHKLHYDDRVASLVKRKASYPIDGYVVRLPESTNSYLLCACATITTRANVKATSTVPSGEEFARLRA